MFKLVGGDKAAAVAATSKNEAFLVFINIRSLAKKLDRLEVFLNEVKPIFVCIAETWLGEERNVSLPGYTLTSKYCRQPACNGAFYGGVAIFTNKNYNIETKILDVSKYVLEGCVELTAIHCVSENCIILNIYRTPNTTKSSIELFAELVSQAVDELRTKTQKLIICGDFNFDCKAVVKESRELTELVAMNNLQILVDEPTRKKSNACLDNVLTDIERVKVKVIEPALSDHKAIVLMMDDVKTEITTGIRKVRQYKNENFQNFQMSLRELIATGVSHEENPEVQYSKFSATIQRIFEQSFPLRNSNVKKSTWIDDEIKDMREWLIILKETAFESKKSEESFKSFQAKYIRTLQMKKSGHIQKAIYDSKNPAMELWNQVRQHTNYKEVKNKNFVQNDKSKSPVESLNEYNLFLTTLKDRIEIMNTNVNPLQLVPSVEHTCVLYPTDKYEIESIAMSLKNNNSVGEDNIPVKIVKNSIALISDILANIFNNMIEVGVYPSQLKIAKIIPIHKKGDPKEFGNYRPLALLPNFAKIFEKLIYTRLYKYLQKHKLLSSNQFGYRKGVSTAEALFEIIEEIVQDDHQNPNLAVFCDLTKAFDLVDRELLLKILERIGIRGKAGDLMKSYLTGWLQYAEIKVDGKTYISAKLLSEQGVIQGSILGPLLFILYTLFVNEVLSKGSATDYVDDKTIVYKHLSSEVEWKFVRNELQDLREMMAAMSQAFSAEKSVCMIFSSNRKNRHTANEILVGEGQNQGVIRRVESHKVLGLIIEERLEWNAHIDGLVRKMGSYCFAINRMRNLLHTKDIIKLYYAFVYSLFKYCIIFWGNSSGCERVFKVQKRILRNIFGLKRRETCKNLFKKEGIMTVYSAYIREAVLFVYKNKKYFLFNKDVQGYRGRRGNEVRIDEIPRGMQGAGPKINCALIYNKMPAEIKNEEDPAKFKSLVTEFCKTNVFYSLKEL